MTSSPASDEILRKDHFQNSFIMGAVNKLQNGFACATQAKNCNLP
jgi:hypothetical protein